MIEAIEILRNLAGVMFWTLTDFVLGIIWLVIICWLIHGIRKGTKKDD